MDAAMQAVCVRTVLSVVMASVGVYQMKLTRGESGIGWVVLGLAVLWT